MRPPLSACIASNTARLSASKRPPMMASLAPACSTPALARGPVIFLVVMPWYWPMSPAGDARVALHSRASPSLHHPSTVAVHPVAPPAGDPLPRRTMTGSRGRRDEEHGGIARAQAAALPPASACRRLLCGHWRPDHGRQDRRRDADEDHDRVTAGIVHAAARPSSCWWPRDCPTGRPRPPSSGSARRCCSPWRGRSGRRCACPAGRSRGASRRTG